VTRVSGSIAMGQPMLGRCPALPKHAEPSGQSLIPGIPRNLFPYESDRQGAWAGPPPCAGAGSFPKSRLFVIGVMRFTGTSRSADKGTIR